MRLSDKPIANPVVVLREELDEWAVLFNPDTADAVGINPVGIVIWRLMDGQRKVDDIVGGVKNSFSDVPEVISQEVTSFIGDLAERGFVVYELESNN